MIDTPVTRYAERDGVSLAYQVFGAGDLDVVLVPGGVSHVDLAWQDRRYARFMRRLGSSARVTVFDKRGMGASDPVVRPPTLAERSEDIQTVMDAAGVREAALFGLSEGATSAALFAVTFPRRTRALVMCGAFPGGSELADVEPDYPAEAMGRFWKCVVEPWQARFGQGVTIELFAPSLVSNERRRGDGGVRARVDDARDVPCDARKRARDRHPADPGSSLRAGAGDTPPRRAGSGRGRAVPGRPNPGREARRAGRRRPPAVAW